MIRNLLVYNGCIQYLYIYIVNSLLPDDFLLKYLILSILGSFSILMGKRKPVLYNFEPLHGARWDGVHASVCYTFLPQTQWFVHMWIGGLWTTRALQHCAGNQILNTPAGHRTNMGKLSYGSRGFSVSLGYEHFRPLRTSCQNKLLLHGFVNHFFHASGLFSLPLMLSLFSHSFILRFRLISLNLLLLMKVGCWWVSFYLLDALMAACARLGI